jgi:hypothetical protein
MVRPSYSKHDSNLPSQRSCDYTAAAAAAGGGGTKIMMMMIIIIIIIIIIITGTHIGLQAGWQIQTYIDR